MILKLVILVLFLSLNVYSQNLNEKVTITNEAKKKIMFFEGGPYLRAYKGHGGHYLIGWGHNCNNPTLKVTIQKAKLIFKKDIQYVENAIRKDVKVVLNRYQFSVLVDLYFNMGIYKLKKSILMTKLNNGDYKGAGKEIKKYVKAKGKVLKGLVRRRNWGYKYWNTKNVIN